MAIRKSRLTKNLKKILWFADVLVITNQFVSFLDNLINFNHSIGYESSERFVQKPKRWFSLREPNKPQKT